jgi:hypothetical protein
MIHRIGIRLALGAFRLRAGQLLPEPVGETGNDLVLHVKKVSDRLVETFSPEMAPSLGVDQLHVDPHPSATALHATFEHIASVKVATDLFHVGRLALECEGRVARDDESAGDARKV